MEIIDEMLGVSKQLVKQGVKGLVDLGYIELNPDPDDKRAKVISPTVQGRRIIPLASESFAKIEQALEARLGADNLQKLRTVLEMSWGAPLE